MDDYIYGRNSVLEALRAGRPINKLMVAKGSAHGSIREITALAKERNILLQFVDKKQLDFLVGEESHQGVAAQTASKEYSDWEEVLTEVQTRKEEPLFLMLDGVEDPHNLGAVLRTADAAGVHCVIIPKHRAVPLTAGVAKAAAGAVEFVPVARVTNLAATIDRLKENGFWVIGTDAAAEQQIYAADLQGPLVLVLGSENKGLSKLVRDKCDALIGIPMRGRLNSLNVSVAAAVVVYEAVRQRLSPQ
ncbi:MAG: 23S rRNA (guanosine(2251)-2'-O)-methyltransferase RlmB [Clostridia bacterium]|jgi:23S rRNA (guanosine2251-2'-O)-methyltransferase|nr:23S rRNA (guanosine(2251)-2'-O)-methyltransferase RlmB [Clostridia bacterium]